MDYSFGNWVKRRRKSLDLTQLELAQQVGCSLATIVKIEADERRPSRQVAELLAKHLEIPPDQHGLFLKIARHETRTEALDSLPRPAAPSPGPVSQPLRQTSLPVPLTPILGREHEVRAILQQLQDPACRLLTLTGPGGVGKTRLALEVAHQLPSLFSEGAFFIPLAGTSASDYVIPAIGNAMGFAFSGTRALKTQLYDFLREKQVLLVLDNLEHLLDGIEVLDEFLERCPGVKLLATSREPLNLRTEWTFEVQGLPIPPETDLAEAESNSASALFLQRARQTKAGFIPSPEDIQAITQICRLVEGLPLGLELAATWVRILSPKEIAGEIEKSLDFLSTTARDVPHRHRSLRAVFDYSWELLTEAEQRMLRQLAVFSGGFTREAAGHVAGASLAQLSALVGKSLLRRTELHPGWYDFHELIRQYINQKAQDKPEEHNRLHERHAGYYAAWLQRLESSLQGPQQEEMLSQLGLEIDNLRSAWHWMVSQRHTYHLQLSLASLFILHDIWNWLHQGVDLFEQAVRAFQHHEKIDGEPDANAILLGELMVCQGHMCWHLGQTQKARDLLQRSLHILRSKRDRPMLAEAVLYLSLLEHSQGNYPAARLLAEECVSLNRKQQRPSGVGYSLSNLGMICLSLGEHETAYTCLKDSVTVMQSSGHPRGTAINMSRLGWAALRLGRYDEARELLEESLETTRRLRDRWGIGNALNYLGLLAQSLGDLDRAESLIRESTALFEQDGDQIMLASNLTDLGFIHLERNAKAQARQAFLKAIQIALQSNTVPVGLYALVGFAELQAMSGEKERAYELAGYCGNHLSSTWRIKERANHLRTHLDGEFSPQQREELQARVHGKTFEEVAQEALTVAP